MRALIEEHGSATRVAQVLGVTSRTVERAKKGSAGPRVLSRLRAAMSSGEVFDAAREARLELYGSRHDAGLGVFDGLPPCDAVSVDQLAREAAEAGPDEGEPTTTHVA